jgi:hypothetical protein
MKRQVLRLFVAASLSMLLTGCLQDSLKRWIHSETYEFQGDYSNTTNSDVLQFKDGSVTFTSAQQSWNVPYNVDEGFVHIQVRNNSKEQRPDIVMRIHNKGAQLICSACGKYSLSNVWDKKP